MSAMSEIFMDIENMLINGDHPTVIAQTLGVPVYMVYDVLESIGEEPTEDLSPYETINS
jgi:hypothetical protein